MNLRIRFWSKVAPPNRNGCRLFQGALDDGYGRFWINGKLGLAHRVAWELTYGPISPGLHLDHLCRNRSCVNPEHLEPVSHAENVLRGEGITAVNARKTHCKRGHELTEENTYRRRDRNTRACIKCQRDAVRKFRGRQKEEVPAA